MEVTVKLRGYANAVLDTEAIFANTILMNVLDPTCAENMPSASTSLAIITANARTVSSLKHTMGLCTVQVTS